MKEVNVSSEELMHKILFNLGFTETEAAVYVYLTKEGPRKAGIIGKALNLHKQRLYRSLRKMQNKGVIETSEHPAIFLAMPFEKVLDLVIKANIEEAKRMMQNKEDLLSSWRSMTEKDEEKS